jgi:polyisoprenoid-binding protein YceI
VRWNKAPFFALVHLLPAGVRWPPQPLRRRWPGAFHELSIPRFTLLAALFAAGAQPVAEAAEYADVNTTASTISFTYDQMGASVYGTFSRFEGSLYFDTVRPESAHARLIIELDSIDAGSSDANSELKKTAWFDTAVYPQAIFESIGAKDLGNNRYQITGHLTLRGKHGRWWCRFC